MEAQPSQAKAIDPEMKVEKVDAVNSSIPCGPRDDMQVSGIGVCVALELLRKAGVPRR